MKKEITIKFKLNYILIPLATIAIALIGGYFTQNNMDWYNEVLKHPDITPPNKAFPIAWNTIYPLAAISALIIWNSEKKEKILWFIKNKEISTKISWIKFLFILNGLFNLFWTIIFFQWRLLSVALFEAILLEITLLALLILNWKVSKIASLLLIPYTLWLGFAIYLNYAFALIN